MQIYDMGNRLRDLRKKRELTQKQVAEKLGLTESAISTYERNTSCPPGDVIKALAELFKTSADYILGIEHRQVISVEGLSAKQIEAVTVIIDGLQCQ